MPTRITVYPLGCISPHDILFSAQLALSWAFFIAAAVPAASDVAEVFHLLLHVYFELTHITLCLSIQAANSLARQNAPGNYADRDNPRHSPALSSIWSVHCVDAKAPVNLPFFQLNRVPY